MTGTDGSRPRPSAQPIGRGTDADTGEGVAVVGETPDRARDYLPPRTPPRVSDHKTLDSAPVRLAPEIDPRRQPTQRVRALRGRPAAVPSGAPAQVDRRRLVVGVLVTVGVLVLVGLGLQLGPSDRDGVLERSATVGSAALPRRAGETGGQRGAVPRQAGEQAPPLVAPGRVDAAPGVARRATGAQVPRVSSGTSSARPEAARAASSVASERGSPEPTPAVSVSGRGQELWLE